MPLRFIDNAAFTGRVGIGTSSPASKLHIESDLGASGTFLTLKNSNATYLNSYTVGTVNKVLKVSGGGSSQDAVMFEDTLYLGMGSNTNVGIGTTSPAQKLHVDGNTLISAERYYYVAGGGAGVGSDASGNLILRQNSANLMTTSGSNATFAGSVTSSNFIISDGTDNYIQFDLNGKNSHFTNQSKSFIFSGQGASGDYLAGTLNFQSRSSVDRDINFITGATPAKRLTISGSGNVGIGTASPANKLTVRTSTINDGLYLETSQPVTYGKIYNSNSESFPVGNLNLAYGTNSTAIIQALSNRMSLKGGYTTGGQISFLSASTEIMRMTSTGLGIGTTSPAQALEVNGIIQVSNTYKQYLLQSHNTYGNLLLQQSGAATIPLTVNSANLGIGVGNISLQSALNVNGGIAAGSYYNTAAPANGMIISGNVGIGTTSPGVELDVTGQIRASSGLEISGGNINLVDNSRIRLGSSVDFQIYHDGSNSYITDTGTGDLYIRGSNSVYIGNSAGTKTYISGTDGGATKLYYNGAGAQQKLETTNTGVSVTGTATATTFSGDLNGTINTATTAVTKANATNDTTVATTAFVQNLIGTIPAGLVFQGTWDAATNTPTLTSGSGTTGHFYIVSTDGSTNLDGITDWKVGDWAVFVEQGATDAWEKVDNSSVLDGSGTGQKVALWSGSGTSNTLTDAPITVSGSNVGIGTTSPSQTLSVEGNIELGTGGYIYGDTTTPYLRLNNAAGAFLGYNASYVTVGGPTTVVDAGTYVARFRSNKVIFTQPLFVGTSNINDTPTAELQVKGSGTTSATTALLVQNSATTELFRVRDDGNVYAHGSGAVTSNTVFGKDAFINNSTGANNTAIGTEALRDNSTGSKNVALGFSALLNNTASNNTAVGYEALRNNTTSVGVTAVGYSALRNNTASLNTAVGYGASQFTTSGIGNISLGYNALNRNSTGSLNVGVGTQALELNTTGSNNVALGYQSLYINLASNNTAVGHQTLYNNTTGADLVALGYRALYNNTTGIRNIAIGYNALTLNSTGLDNVAVGESALFNNTSSFNTAIGRESLRFNTTGANNTANGFQSLRNNTTGSNNVALGYQAGYETGNLTGTSNTFLGYNASYGTATTITNSTAVGANVTLTDSNTVILGNNANVGIGITSPATKLHVQTTSGVTARFAYDSNNYQDLNWEGSNIVGGSHTFKIAGSEKMRIDSGGKVLIGVTSNQTQSKLTSRQDGSSIEFGHLNQSGQYYGTLGAMSSSGSPFIAFSADNTNSNTFTTRGAKGFVISQDTNISGDLIFSSVPNANLANQSLVERMRITSAGNIGIGTTSPSEKLYVAGSIGVNTGQSLKWGAGATRIVGVDGSYIAMYPNNSEKVRFLSNGNVLIGTTTDSGYKLAVEGSVAVQNAQNLWIRGGRIGFENTALNNAAYIYNIGASGSSKLNIADSLYVVEAGNVGIGTTSPTTPLHVAGITQIVESGNTAFYGGNYVRMFNNQNYNFRNSGGTTIANIAMSGNTYFNGGNVGIGTTSPAHTLSINGTVSSNLFRGYTYPDNSFLDFDKDDTVAINYTALASIGRIAYLADTNTNEPATNAAHEFFTGTSDIDTATSLMIIQTDGNVGIGTTGPVAPLDVNGNIQITGVGNTLIFDNSSVKWQQYVNGNEFTLRYNGGVWSERLRVDTDGNVGISTTNPTEKLDVNGTVKSTGLYVTSTPRIDAGGGSQPGPTPLQSPSDAIVKAGGDTAIYLSEPDEWLVVNIGGVDYVIPAYL